MVPPPAPSSTLMPPSGPNPMYGSAHGLLNRRPEFVEIAKAVARKCMKRFNKTMLSPAEMALFKKMVAEEMKAEREKFDSLVTEIITMPEPPQLMPQPPRPSEVYGRIADGSPITDVGSGNCFKLGQHSGRLKITAIDPDLPAVSNLTITKIKRPVQPEDVAGKVVTSVSALCAIKDDEAFGAITSQDGLHLVPDHKELVDMGCAIEDVDEVIVHAPHDKVFRDRKIDMPGYKISTGYVLAPTFQRRKIVLHDMPPVTSWRDHDGYRPTIDCVPCGPADINWADMGWKWDGEPIEIETQGNTYIATRRDGTSVSGIASGDLCNFSLHAEWMPRVNTLVLIRIEAYHEYVPPHCGDALRTFCDRVELTIAGEGINTKLVGPPLVDFTLGPVVEGVLCPVDGIISRSRMHDYYLKPVWTVDLTPLDLQALEQYLKDRGMLMEVDTVGDGLWEYVLRRQQQLVSLVAQKARRDKDRGTTLSTVEYLLDLPTLHELVAIVGRTPAVVGLQEFFVDM